MSTHTIRITEQQMEYPAARFRRHLFLLLTFAVLRLSSAASSYPKEALPTKSGYLTVNSTTGSAIFYTYYEAQNFNPQKNTPTSQIPILIWLQGGPGCSSMLANLFELGPWLVNQEVKLEPNPNSWNNMFGLLFLDNPIGTGFSIAASPEEIPTNQHDIAKHLFTAIQEFVALDKSLNKRPIYVTGESYAGKYLPALGYYILKKNPNLPREKRVNLAGVAIGNGLTDPGIQVTSHAAIAYNLGFINQKQTEILEKLQSDTVKLVKQERWNDARVARFQVLGTLTNMTGLSTLYDFRRVTPYPNRVVTQFLNNAEVKRALGVDESLTFALCSTVVADALNEDAMKSVRSMVEFLVPRTRVLLYQGNCDLRDGPASTLAWVRKMKWDGIQRFLDAERKIWTVDGLLAGYVQRWGNLSEVVVVNAGHLVPTDQPVNSKEMMQDWILQRRLFAAQN